MICFGLPMAVPWEGDFNNYYDEYISGSIAAGPRLSALDIWRIHGQSRPTVFVMHIVVVCTEATPVIHPPSLLQLLSMESLLNLPTQEDFVTVTGSVVT